MVHLKDRGVDEPSQKGLKVFLGLHEADETSIAEEDFVLHNAHRRLHVARDDTDSRVSSREGKSHLTEIFIIEFRDFLTMPEKGWNTILISKNLTFGVYYSTRRAD